MSENITINYAIALCLNKVCDEILHEYKENPDGSVSKVERPLNFRLKYRIQKNLNYIQKDVYNFEKFKVQLLATYGDLDESKQNVVLSDPKKKELFIKSINNILTTEIAHPITRIDPEDIEQLTYDTKCSFNEIKLFQAYLCNESELLKDLNTEVELDFGSMTGDKVVSFQTEEKNPSNNEKIEEKTVSSEKEEPKKERKPRTKKTAP